jgi:hypothetical protein
MRVASARIGQDEQPRAVHGGFLEPGRDGRRLGVTQHPPQRAIHRHTDERHHLRTVLFDLPLEDLPAFEVLGRAEIVDAGAGARDQVRHTEPPLGQTHVPFVRDGLGNDAGFVQQAPEPVGRPGEVMPRLRRAHAGVDADEQDAQARRDPIRQAQIGPRGLRIFVHELAVQGRTHPL